ncbi:uncharacterized protein BP01DRAFT_98117 [Aspergillus saccharolyticus JOP 1030-1]|uniref:Cora-domain-containing protein n=1 Tax=Aspergillus saccharolyticus JOP 1030-1 TaxID=1450539 RepID=A0A318ZTN4_9EURO|nr:hypothetical protein BP01DRAFT_98117 [Aspergillus saccharolyticus JOP 1030-1]PYH43448.1 hypothetical protein BP01DRAFT_98117 [Aspergillus saccharolyticus JOP 1030-1]
MTRANPAGSETDDWVESQGPLEALDVTNPRFSTVIFTTTSSLNYPHRLALFPPRFHPIITADLNGSFDCEDIPDETGQFIHHISWSTFKIKHVRDPHDYDWTQATCYIHWNPPTGTQTVFIIDLPTKDPRAFLHAIPARLRRHDPYAWHAAFGAALIPVYDQSIWLLRNIVRTHEMGRVDPTLFAPDFFPQLHDIERHIFHADETLEVAQHTLESLVREQIRSARLYAAAAAAAVTPNTSSTSTGPPVTAGFPHHHHHNNNNTRNDRNNTTTAPINQLSTLQTERALRAVAKQLHALHTRGRSLRDRLHNEINLAFNIVSQRFGHDTRSDSAMMTTIAVVSMIYLPGTFVSGLFGTNFFNFTDGDAHTWFMADSFWLYWAVTIPLTLATMAVWAWWHYLAPANRQSRGPPMKPRVKTEKV